MSDIFISYARRDERLAEGLAETLRREGWTVWWDAFLRVGEVFSEGLLAALAEARCVVVLWSSASVTSEWVRTEARAGAKRGVLVHAKIEDSIAIPQPFAHLQAARLTGWDGRRRWHPGFRRLVEGITRAGPGYPLASEPLEFSKVLDIPGASCLASAFGSLWVATKKRPGLVRLDRTGNRIAEISVGRAWGVISAVGCVWPLHDRGVTRVNPDKNEISAELELGPYRGSVDLALSTEGVLWVVALRQSLIPEIYALPAAGEKQIEFGSFIEANPEPSPIVLLNDHLLVGTVDGQELQVLSGPHIAVERTITTGEISGSYTRKEDSLWWFDSDTDCRRLDLRTLEIRNLRLPSNSTVLGEAGGQAYIGFMDAPNLAAKIAELNISSGDVKILHTLDRTILGKALVGGGFLWIEAWPSTRVIQIDLESKTLVSEIPINGSLRPWRFHGGALDQAEQHA